MTRTTFEGDSSNLPVSDPAAPDAEEDVTLGNISTEAQVNFQLTEVTVLHNQLKKCHNLNVCFAAQIERVAFSAASATI